jgi:hypothetical protein
LWLSTQSLTAMPSGYLLHGSYPIVDLSPQHLVSEPTTMAFVAEKVPPRILRVTVHQAIYPITEGVLHQVFDPMELWRPLKFSQEDQGSWPSSYTTSFSRNKAHTHSKAKFDRTNRATKTWLYCIKLVSLDLYWNIFFNDTNFIPIFFIYLEYILVKEKTRKTRTPYSLKRR